MMMMMMIIRCSKEPDLELEGLLKRHYTTVAFFQGTMMNAVDLERVKVPQPNSARFANHYYTTIKYRNAHASGREIIMNVAATRQRESFMKNRIFALKFSPLVGQVSCFVLVLQFFNYLLLLSSKTHILMLFAAT